MTIHEDYAPGPNLNDNLTLDQRLMLGMFRAGYSPLRYDIDVEWVDETAVNQPRGRTSFDDLCDEIEGA